MKKSNWIFASTLFALLLSATFATAQNSYDYNSGYDYDDNVVIINDYDGDRNYRDGNKNRKRNKKRVRQERQWKASIIDRAYRIAQADGRITRGERREIHKLERDLGIQRKGRRNHRGHNHR